MIFLSCTFCLTKLLCSEKLCMPPLLFVCAYLGVLCVRIYVRMYSLCMYAYDYVCVYLSACVSLCIRIPLTGLFYLDQCSHDYIN